MNAPHLHLLLVHIPIVLVPTGLLMLLFAIYFKHEVVRRVALVLFTAAAMVTIPTFLIGEEAEEAIEDLPGISERTMHDHEEAAEVALWLTVILGALSGLTLIGTRTPKLEVMGRLTPVILVVAVASTAALAFTGNQGGKIRHPEALGTAPAGGPTTEQGEQEEGDAD